MRAAGAESEAAQARHVRHGQVSLVRLSTYIKKNRGKIEKNRKKMLCAAVLRCDPYARHGQVSLLRLYTYIYVYVCVYVCVCVFVMCVFICIRKHYRHICILYVCIEYDVCVCVCVCVCVS